jgi:hypothetical protein
MKISPYYSVFFITLFGSIGLSLITSDFKIFMVGVFTLFILLYFSLQDIFISLWVLLLIAAQFQLPGKYYTFELVSKNNFYFPELQDGLLEGFGLVSSDIVAIAIVLLLIHQLLTKKSKKITTWWGTITRDTHSKIILTCWVIYFSISFFFSGLYSIFSTFSTVVLIQYLKMPLTFIISLSLFRQKNIFKTLFLYTIAGLLVFQSAVALCQVFGGAKLSGAASGTVVVAEENSLFSRPQGTFAYPNEFGLIQTLFLLILLPVALSRPTTILSVASLAGVGGVILSQGRASWIILVVALCLYLPIYKYRLKQIKKTLTRIRPGILFIALAIPLIIIGERLIASTSFVDDFGGGPLRMSMIRDGLILLKDVPFGGFGAEMSVYELFDKVPKGYIQYFPFAIHLGFLQMALESGIIATFFFFLPFYLTIRRYMVHTKINLKKNPIVSGATLGLAGILMYYSLHPTYGRVEFLYIGILLAASTYE